MVWARDAEQLALYTPLYGKASCPALGGARARHRAIGRRGVPLREEDATRELLLIEEGTLYPALHRLERRAFISAEWGVSDNGRRAKFYTLTTAGRARYRAESRVWHRHAGAIAVALRQASQEAR